MSQTHNRDKSASSIQWDKNSSLLRVRTTWESWSLSWSANVDAVVNKANKILGVVHRTFGPSNLSAFSILHKTLGRRILQISWSGLVPLPSQSPEESITPCDRRQNPKLAHLGETETLHPPYIECYKTVFGLNNLNFSDFFELIKNNCTRAKAWYQLAT